MTIQVHELSCEILVAGGGAAGVPCALAAARRGARVILCQDRPVLGGNASSEVRMHIVGANGTGRFDRGQELQTEAREGGIIEEIRLENSVHNPQRSASVFDLILYDKCRSEPNLTLLLNTCVTQAQVRDGRIQSVTAERPSTEDRFQISAAVFIDCTGDGRLGSEAGAVFMEGRESRQQFQETLAPPDADAKRLGSTILLQARRHDRPMPFTAPAWARQFSRQDLRLRLYATPGEEQPTHEYGYWWAEWGGTLDTIRDNETIRDELLAVALGIWDHVKNGPPEERDGTGEREPRASGTNGCEGSQQPAFGTDAFRAAHWALDWIGFLPGKRESRRFIGQHILTQQEVLQSREFPDAIACGGWSLDLHPPEGVDAPDQAPCEQTPVPYLYDIPLSCCVARDIPNLMFAGRNLSATHVAFSSTRVMATCAVVGQGVGTAAAYAVAHNLSPSVLSAESCAIQTIQQQLLQDDVFLIGRANSDPLDLARQATVSASSEQPSGAAVNVCSGVTRSVHGHRGAPPERRVEGSHRWMSEPSAGLPAWLRLDWSAPIRVRRVQLIFDTGLHRHLTLSHHDGYTGRMLWGMAQPETVRSYRIEVRTAAHWQTVAEVTDNYLRRRIHEVSVDAEVTALRLHVLATHGLDHARLMELRVYGS